MAPMADDPQEAAPIERRREEGLWAGPSPHLSWPKSVDIDWRTMSGGHAAAEDVGGNMIRRQAR